MLDSCLEPGKIETLKMLDSQTKSAINSDKLQVVRHEAAQEMRVGPSESACRSRLQNTSSCIGKKPLW